ncbi:plasminogen-binding N-terminal domain-containing protein [Helicobacter sp. 23-1045]
MTKLLFLLAFVGVAQISAFEVPNILSLTISKQADFGADSALKIPAMDLKVGESGIITREINGNEFIIANALVGEIKDGFAIVSISEFSQMREKYLPKPRGKVSEGDKITFRILYDKALLIAPNQNVYQEISEKFSKIDFLHSDVFATFLAKEGKNMPDSADFAKFCAKFDLGLVFVALQNRVEIFNCESFKMLDSTPFRPKDRSAKKPFFTRISDESINEIFNAKKLENYFTYFNKLSAESSAK